MEPGSEEGTVESGREEDIMELGPEDGTVEPGSE
jgi:hypothetical protein